MSNQIKPIQIAGRIMGSGHPCFIAAEIGLNHNGDMNLAFRTIEAAAQAGADAVKFQNYRTDDFLSDHSLTYEYASAGHTVVESQFDMFKRCELSREQLIMLREHCERCSVIFFSTPTAADGIADLVAANAPLLKNGSDFLTHLPLIRCMARSGIPTVLSTGMATLGEIEDAVDAFREAGGRHLALLHCTSAYPTPDDETNLRRIPALLQRFDCPVGFSDHTWGIAAAPAAVALGACLVEKHFTLDRELHGPDHRFSSDPAELKELVGAIRRMETQLGSPSLGPTRHEEQNRKSFRLSCVAGKDMPAGHRLIESDIAFRRPGIGMPPKYADMLIGRTLAAAITRGHIFTEGSFNG